MTKEQFDKFILEQLHEAELEEGITSKLGIFALMAGLLSNPVDAGVVKKGSKSKKPVSISKTVVRQTPSKVDSKKIDVDSKKIDLEKEKEKKQKLQQLDREIDEYTGPLYSTNTFVELQALENSKNYAPGKFDKKSNSWFIYMDNGKESIAYGHNLTPEETATKIIKVGGKSYDVRRGLPDTAADELLKTDIQNRENNVSSMFGSSWSTFPEELKSALRIAYYRGDLLSKHNTVKLLASGDPIKIQQAGAEFLHNQNYLTGNAGIKSRMMKVAKAIKNYGVELQSKKSGQVAPVTKK